MKVPELKARAKKLGLKGYSKLRKAELIALLTPPAPAPHTRPPKPTRPPPPPLPNQIDQIDQDNWNYTRKTIFNRQTNKKAKK